MRYEQVGERWIIRIMDNGAAALVDVYKRQDMG